MTSTHRPARIQTQPVHHSRVQARTAAGQWCHLNNPRLHPRFWLLAVRLGVAHPRIRRLSALTHKSVPTADTVLADANSYVSARANYRYLTGKPHTNVRLFGLATTSVDRPTLWPSGAQWPAPANTPDATGAEAA